MSEYVKLDDVIKKFLEAGQNISKDQAIYLLNRVPTVDKKTIFEDVYDQLTEIPMFVGLYDAKNGNEHFMFGIETVMEVVAYLAGKHDEYEDEWAKNMRVSADRAEKRTARENENIQRIETKTDTI